MSTHAKAWKRLLDQTKTASPAKAQFSSPIQLLQPSEAGLTEAAAEAALQNAIQRILLPREAVETMKKELAQLLQKSADSFKMRCHKFLSKVWIFSRFDGLALVLGCSPNSSTVRMAWERLKVAYPDLEGRSRVVTDCDSVQIPETFKFEGPREQETLEFERCHNL